MLLGAPVKILVVDDQRAMAETVADGLADHGMEARAVTSGGEAVRLLRDHPFDAVVTDLRMPEVDGLAVALAARDLSRPVVIMTAYGERPHVAGRVQWLEKPFRIEALVRLLREAM
ncbi:MAG: response regulator [Polyangiales bacterium]